MASRKQYDNRFKAEVVINTVFTFSLRKVYLSNPRVVLLEDL